MLIYGRGVSQINSVQLVNEVCPSCNQKGTLLMSVYSKHAHIFWIPTFPIGKVGVSTCANCGQNIQQEQMPANILDHYKKVSSASKVPVWKWSGLVLIFVLVGSIAYSINRDNANEQIYIKAPAIGDLYEYKTEEGNYSLMKVVDVTADSVIVQYNSYESDKMSGVYKLKDKEFVEDEYILSKAQILEMYNSKKIYSIERK